MRGRVNLVAVPFSSCVIGRAQAGLLRRLP